MACRQGIGRIRDARQYVTYLASEQEHPGDSVLSLFSNRPYKTPLSLEQTIINSLRRKSGQSYWGSIIILNSRVCSACQCTKTL